MKMMKGMLVLELCSVLAGPSVCQFCAELGAKVIKVENSVLRGDVTRTWKFKGEGSKAAVATASAADMVRSKPLDPSVTSYFSACNAGKLSISLNLQSKQGLGIVHKLAKKADIVVASYKPGDAQKLQVDYISLSKLNPRLVYAEISGYGHDNPRAGYDAIIQAEAGFQYINGSPDSPPTKMPVALMDLLAAHQLKQAILLSLWEREKTGKGAHVHVSLFESAVSSLANQATTYLIGNKVPERIGSDHPSIAPYGTLFSTKDNKELVPAVGTDKQFYSLCEILGRVDIAKDEKFAKNANRVINRAELTSLLSELIKKWNRDELLHELDQKSVPFGAVNAMNDVFNTELGKKMVIRDDSNIPVGVKQVAFQRLSSPSEKEETIHATTSSLSYLPPPAYALHTRQVLKDELSMTDAEIDTLVASNIIHDTNHQQQNKTKSQTSKL